VSSLTRWRHGNTVARRGEHDLCLLRFLFLNQLARDVSLGKAKLDVVVSLPLPTRGGRNRVVAWWTLAMAIAMGVMCRRWHFQAPVAWQGQSLARVRVCSASQWRKDQPLALPRGRIRRHGHGVSAASMG
jgi:hypothetical protein